MLSLLFSPGCLDECGCPAVTADHTLVAFMHLVPLGWSPQEVVVTSFWGEGPSAPHHLAPRECVSGWPPVHPWGARAGLLLPVKGR